MKRDLLFCDVDSLQGSTSFSYVAPSENQEPCHQNGGGFMKGSWKEKRTDKQKNKSKERDRKKKENSYVDGNLILPAI